MHSIVFVLNFSAAGKSHEKSWFSWRLMCFLYNFCDTTSYRGNRRGNLKSSKSYSYCSPCPAIGLLGTQTPKIPVHIYLLRGCSPVCAVPLDLGSWGSTAARRKSPLLTAELGTATREPWASILMSPAIHKWKIMYGNILFIVIPTEGFFFFFFFPSC